MGQMRIMRKDGLMVIELKKAGLNHIMSSWPGAANRVTVATSRCVCRVTQTDGYFWRVTTLIGARRANQLFASPQQFDSDSEVVKWLENGLLVENLRAMMTIPRLLR